jgi:hypothetical protein
MYILWFRPWKFYYKVLIYEESQNVLTNFPVLPGYFFKKGVMAASLGLLRQNPEKRPSQTLQNLRSESRKTAKSSWPEPQIRDQKGSQSSSPGPQERVLRNSQVQLAKPQVRVQKNSQV